MADTLAQINAAMLEAPTLTPIEFFRTMMGVQLSSDGNIPNSKYYEVVENHWTYMQVPHIKFEIASSQLAIESVSQDDAEEALRMVTDPLNHNSDWSWAAKEYSVAVDLVQGWVNPSLPKPQHFWFHIRARYPGGDVTYIGLIGVENILPIENRIYVDQAHSAEISMVINHDETGKGRAYPALRMALDFAHRGLQIEVCKILVHPNNGPMRTVIDKLGPVVRMVPHMETDEIYRLVFVVMRSDWLDYEHTLPDFLPEPAPDFWCELGIPEYDKKTPLVVLDESFDQPETSSATAFGGSSLRNLLSQGDDSVSKSLHEQLLEEFPDNDGGAGTTSYLSNGLTSDFRLVPTTDLDPCLDSQEDGGLLVECNGGAQQALSIQEATRLAFEYGGEGNTQHDLASLGSNFEGNSVVKDSTSGVEQSSEEGMYLGEVEDWEDDIPFGVDDGQEIYWPTDIPWFTRGTSWGESGWDITGPEPSADEQL